ncbi:anti-sigma factor [Streptomyces tagetis]|uniref:Regulator of SigK n=1 Tax=Streptomyces tagetis TaxID=2820809 RepID=A0A941B341_9ACTN|nr:anti-sigma factor [Streptomyces sp. RG38]MBQ0829886.1 anti-sigma factor [Streptomyces sp. RG38]
MRLPRRPPRPGDDLHSLAAPYALDALDHAERDRYEHHLAACAECAAEVRTLAEDTVRLARSTAVPAPAALRARVLAAVRTAPQEPAAPREPASSREPAARRRARRLPRTGAARARRDRFRPSGPWLLLVPFATTTAAAALVVAALFAAEAHRTREELDAARDRAREIAHVLAAPDARAAGGADETGGVLGVVASASEGRAVVTLGGYGRPPGDRVHQLWLVRPGAPPHSLGLFDGDAPLLASGLEPGPASLAVTVEPGGGSSRPTGTPLVQVALESVGFGG